MNKPGNATDRTATAARAQSVVRQSPDREARGDTLQYSIDLTPTRRAVIVVEPVEQNDRSHQAAARAATAIMTALSRLPASPAVAAITTAFSVANCAVRQGEAPALDGGPARRALVGATVALIDPTEVTIGQAPPCQALVLQDGWLDAIPPFASWLPGYEPDDLEATSSPLGAHADITPLIAVTEFHETDLFAAASSPVGRLLAVLPEDFPWPSDSPRFAATLADLIDQSRLDCVVAEAFGPAGPPAGAGADIFGELPSMAAMDAATGFSPLALTFATPLAARVQAATEKARLAVRDRARPIAASIGMRLQARNVRPEPTMSTRIAPQPLSPCLPGLSEDSRMRSIALSGHVERHRSSSFKTASGITPMLPRTPMKRLPVRFLALALVVMTAVAGFVYTTDQKSERSVRIEQALAIADASLAAAESAGDVTTAKSQLSTASGALTIAGQNGAGPTLLGARMSRLGNVQDEINGIVRLDGMERIGGVPADVLSTRATLFRAGRDFYLLTDTLYLVDMTGDHLVRVLGPGDTLGKSAVKPLRGATVDNGHLIVTDGFRLYRQGDNGKWKASKLGLLESGSPWSMTSAGSLDGSLYLLDATNGQILKFSSDSLRSMPANWAGDDARAILHGGRGMLVDQSIYVLLADGTIQPLYRGSVQPKLSVDVSPALTQPLAFYGAQDSSRMYVTDQAGSVGRISGIDRNGQAERQFLLSGSEPGVTAQAEAAFANIDAFAVDELSGTIVILSGGDLWVTTIPGLSSVAQR